MSDFENVCRLCLGGQPTLDIFGTLIVGKIESCCTLQMQENDGLPGRICFTCAHTLDVAVNFKIQCEESDKTLRRKLNIAFPSNVKYESTGVKVEDPLILYDIPEIKDETVSVKDEDYCENDFNNASPFDDYIEDSIKSENSSDFKRNSNDKSLSKNKKNDCTRNSKKVMVNFANVTIKNSEPSNLKSHKKKSVIKKNNNKNSLSIKSTKRKRCNENVQNVVKKKSFIGLCPFCGEVYPRASFYKHVRTHNEKPFKCDICNKGFYHKGKLITHIKIHGEKEFPCEICGKLFKSTYDSHRHVEIVHKRSRAVECSTCGKKLATKFGLKMHLKTHTGEKAFECDICKQKFTFRYTMILHMRTHTGEKPYVCRFCEAKFSVQKTLKEHERLHTGETPYNCPVCTKGFSQLSNMKSHFRNNHRVAYTRCGRKTTEATVIPEGWDDAFEANMHSSLVHCMIVTKPT